MRLWRGLAGTAKAGGAGRTGPAMASLTAAEQRPLIVFYFADCDPSGWQMGISVSRKLQALSELLGPPGLARRGPAGHRRPHGRDREKVMATARDKLSQARALVDEVSQSLQTSTEPDDLPPFDPPEPRCYAGDALPSGLGTTLVTSEWSYPEQCQALKDSKAYGGDEDGSPEGGEEDERR
jgi:hypothetical protein